MEEQLKFLTEKGLRPIEYIVEKCNQNDVILLGEDHRVRENLKFVTSLIPHLYVNGVYTLGLEFGAEEDQEALDHLVIADQYDPLEARRILRSYNLAWAYKEYLDIYYEVWKWNRSLPKDVRPFRILNLSYRFDWTSYHGRPSPANYARVFMRGPIDLFRANRIQKEILDISEKILVLTGTVHAFTTFSMPDADPFDHSFVRYERRYMGNLLADRFLHRIKTVLLHQPFWSRDAADYHAVSPGRGLVEQVLQERGNQAIGFDLNDTAMGMLEDTSQYSAGKQKLRLMDLADGYVFLQPLKKLNGCTVDTEFINGLSWEDVKMRVDCELRKRPESLFEFWEQIRDYADLRDFYDAAANAIE